MENKRNKFRREKIPLGVCRDQATWELWGHEQRKVLITLLYIWRKLATF